MSFDKSSISQLECIIIFTIVPVPMLHSIVPASAIIPVLSASAYQHYREAITAVYLSHLSSGVEEDVAGLHISVKLVVLVEICQTLR